MTNRTRRIAIVTLCVTTFACGGTAGTTDQAAAGAAAQGSGLEGAWRLAEYRPGDAAAVTDPASVFLFSDGYYSIAYANTSGPRATFANPDTPTDADKQRAYETIIANAGAYSITGDTLIVRPQISKHPNYMGGGEDRFVMRHAGDTLWLTSVPGAFRWAGGQTSGSSGTSDLFRLIRARP